MMQYYEQQKEIDPYNTSAVFIAPLWTQKKWFSQYFANMQMVDVLKKGQHAFLIPSERLGEPTGKLVDIGPLHWDVGIFYDGPRFAKSPHSTRPRSKPFSEYMLYYTATHADEAIQATTPSGLNEMTWDDGNYDPNVPDDMQMHQSTAAGDLQIFAEWMHDLRDAYGKDEFVKRLRSGENIPHYKVKSGMVYYSTPEQRVPPCTYLRRQ